MCLRVEKLEVRAHRPGISGWQRLRLGTFSRERQRVRSSDPQRKQKPKPRCPLLRLSSKPALDKRLFDSCGSKKHESANLLNTSMWMRVSSNGLQTTGLSKESLFDYIHSVRDENTLCFIGDKCGLFTRERDKAALTLTATNSAAQEKTV